VRCFPLWRPSADTRATESWDKNIPVARARLEPLGIRVFSFTENHNLPFEDSAFDLALNRHGAYDPLELRRILKPGGILLTQQVGGQNMMRINQLLQDEVHFEFSFWTPAYAIEQLEAAGFATLQAREDFPEVNFYTLGALVYYLKVISWQVEGFTPQAYLEKLYAIYTLIQQEGKLVTHEHRFLIEARG
jgi:SAM-dependent methyltransferase